MTAPIGLAKLIWSLLRWTVRWTWKLVTAPFLLVWWCLRAVTRAVLATPRLIFITAPVGAYRRLMRLRDKVLRLVEIAESESAKWRALMTTIKLPYSFLTRTMGLSPPMAISMLLGLSTVAGGVAVNEALQPPSFANGDTGIYSAPLDAPTFFSPEYNTLRIDLGTTPVKLLEITDVSVGTSYVGSALPSGTTSTIDVGGNAGVSTYLIVGEMTFEKNRCETLTLSDISVHTLNITDNISDGQSISPSAGSRHRSAVIAGGGGAADMSTTGGLYDRVWIQAPTSGVNGQIDELTISNLYTRGGACLLSRIRGGTLTVSLNSVGGDSDLATKAFVIGTDVKASVINNTGNREIAMAVPATQTIDN